jgi:hypothetical protein
VSSIVALHGLNGHAFKTWAHGETNCMWLRDLLPHDVDDARVLLYGYNANVYRDAGTARARDFASTFLRELLLRRRSDVITSFQHSPVRP